MITQIIEINSSAESEKIGRVADILNSGGVVAIPTETVYGLAASATDNAAIDKVFEAKGRPQDNPLIVHIANMDMLEQVAADIPDVAYRLAELFWPGPLTMVLKKGKSVCENVSRGMSTVALRMPSDEIARQIIATSNLPIAAPSANISGRPSPTTAAHVIEDLSGKIDAVVKSHDCTIGVESTVISLLGETPRILRPGAVTHEQLENAIGKVEIDSAVLNELEKGAAVASPGMKYKHYAPKAEVFLVEGDVADFVNFVNKQTDAVAVCFKEDTDIKIPTIVYGSKCDELTLAQNVFGVLRDIDKKGFKKAYIHAPSKNGVGLAVYNRLIRAAAFKVIVL